MGNQARAYYNEIDKNAAQWLRNLIDAGLIAPGDVDERSIEDVRPGDLDGYAQCHFFAGIGVWSYALRRAGWPDDRPVWTGSRPCQPFSQAGKGSGFADERHLWPAFHHLIAQRRPVEVFGEQVASPDGLAWLDTVQTDLEGTGYASAAVDLCAAGFGAPHIRQRLFWVAHSDDSGLEGWRKPQRERSAERLAGSGGVVGGVADTDHERRARFHSLLQRQEPGRYEQDRVEVAGGGEIVRSAGPVNGFWRDADWLGCRDGKWRAVEPGTFPLVDESPARVVRLRAYGNAIVSEVAVEFIRAYMEARDAI